MSSMRTVGRRVVMARGLRDVGTERRVRAGGRHRRRADHQARCRYEHRLPVAGDEARLAELGALAPATTVAEFAAFRETQVAFFAEVVTAANIHIE